MFEMKLFVHYVLSYFLFTVRFTAKDTNVAEMFDVFWLYSHIHFLLKCSEPEGSNQGMLNDREYKTYVWSHFFTEQPVRSFVQLSGLV